MLIHFKRKCRISNRHGRKKSKFYLELIVFRLKNLFGVPITSYDAYEV